VTTKNGRSLEWNEMMVQIGRQTREIAYSAEAITIFHDMSSKEKVECYVAGVVLGMMFALEDVTKTKEAMDKLEIYAHACIPVSRQILKQAGHVKSEGNS
jgi:hypothetical protein